MNQFMTVSKTVHSASVLCLSSYLYLTGSALVMSSVMTSTVFAAEAKMKIVNSYQNSNPVKDLQAFRQYFKKKFPKVKYSTYKDGVYAIDAERRATWEDWISFAPPYIDAIEVGEKLFHAKMKSGKTLASCFKNGGKAVRQNYPYFDAKRKDVITLEQTINECRQRNGEKPWPWKKGKLAAVSAYLSSTSKGKKIKLTISKHPEARKFYDEGKFHFYAKRGQLNFSCADCHVHNSGSMARGDLLSPAIGHVTHFPVWRKKWAAAADAKGKTGPLRGLGTLHRRYAGCNKNIRAKPYKAQSRVYKALEYFETYLSQGLEVNGPALRQ